MAIPDLIDQGKAEGIRHCLKQSELYWHTGCRALQFVLEIGRRTSTCNVGGKAGTMFRTFASGLWLPIVLGTKAETMKRTHLLIALIAAATPFAAVVAEDTTKP